MNEEENIFSIWTGKSACPNLHLSNREFINMICSDEGTLHLIRCYDCASRYSVTSKELIESHRNK